MKLKTHYSTFWQLIFLLATALMVLLVILCILLLRVRTQQLHANRDYFQNEVQSTTERLSAQLQEFKVVTAQLTENDLVQAFLVESNTLERWRYSEYIKDLLHILLSNNSQILSVDLYCLNGSRYTFMDTDWYLSSEVQELCNIKDPENKETYFMLINPSKSLVYSRFAYVAPVYDLNNGAKIATLALFGTCESLIDGSTDDYKIVYLMDCFGNCFPRTPSNDLDEYMELDYGVNIGFVQTSDYVDVSQSQYTIMIVMHIIVMSITLVFTGIYLSRWLTHPLLILVNQMNMVKHGTRNCVQTK